MPSIDVWKQLVLAPIDTWRVTEVVGGACHATTHELRILMLILIDRVCVVVVLKV